MDRPQRWAYVLYSGEDGPWHQRWVMGRVASTVGEYVIATPDRDVYVEDYSGRGVDVAAVRWSPVHRPSPPGLGGGRVYRFRAPPTGAAAAELRAAAADAAAERWEELAQAANDGRALPAGGALVDLDGLTGTAGVAAAIGTEARAEVGAGARRAESGEDDARGTHAGGERLPGLWVAVEITSRYERGTILVLPEGAIVKGSVGMFDAGGGEWVLARRMEESKVPEYKGAEAAGDARILPICAGPGSSASSPMRVRRAWRDVVSVLSVSHFGDWPVPGPRTVEWCASFINRRGGGPQDHHRFFKHCYGLTKADWGVDAHGIILHMLEEGGCYDGSEVCNLASMEVAMRHAQLVEYVYVQEAAARDSDKKKGKGRGKGPAGLLDEASVFLGAHKDTGEAMVCPALLEYVSAEVEKDASIMKQVRKAREERRLLKKELGGDKEDK